MLGSQLMQRFTEPIGWDRQDIDVREFEALKQKILELPVTPAAIINCVAYNDVDGAEDNQPDAFALNSEFVGKLAVFCKQLDVLLVHFSSNYVFDGQKGEYDESENPNPLSVYGQSKYQGEKMLRQNTEKFYLVRTALLFGPKGESPSSKTSFVELMLQLSEKNDTIKVINDEFNSLTSVMDLADAVKFLLDEQKPFGIYHIVNSGQANWYDYAQEIFKIVNKPIRLIPVPGRELLRKAPRPKKAVLLNTKLYQLRPWADALKEFLVKDRLSSHSPENHPA